MKKQWISINWKMILKELFDCRQACELSEKLMTQIRLMASLRSSLIVIRWPPVTTPKLLTMIIRPSSYTASPRQTPTRSATPSAHLFQLHPIRPTPRAPPRTQLDPRHIPYFPRQFQTVSSMVRIRTARTEIRMNRLTASWGCGLVSATSRRSPAWLPRIRL